MRELDAQLLVPSVARNDIEKFYTRLIRRLPRTLRARLTRRMTVELYGCRSRSRTSGAAGSVVSGIGVRLRSGLPK